MKDPTSQKIFPGYTPVDFNQMPFVYGREYFVLRSGRAGLILQSDRADVGPAVSYLLFDMIAPGNTRRRCQAINYSESGGFASSALQVILGGFPFTALGARTRCSWSSVDGIPSATVTWWAGGIRVTEEFSALEEGLFRRTIHLDGANLAGEEIVTLRLLPPVEKTSAIQGGNFGGPSAGIDLQLFVTGPFISHAQVNLNAMDITPVPVRPGRRTTVNTAIAVSFPGHPAGASLALAERAAARRWTRRTHLITTDKVVREVYDAARYGLSSMISFNGTMNASIFEYGLQWVRDTSNTLMGAVHCGEFELARTGFSHLLTNMLSREGATMIAGGFDDPDREQLDQMGELLDALHAYRNWTGDDSLIREHRDILLAVIERPLHRLFRDHTGLMHNRREIWERTLSDGYELSSQVYVVAGLRRAVELAGSLGAGKHIPRWTALANEILHATLHHPTHALVHDGHFIKRRTRDGSVAYEDPALQSDHPDAPVRTEKRHLLMPDATQVLPILLGIVDPAGEIARNTLDQVEQLWNTRWDDGGYDRYHSSSQLDQPGPWTFPSCFIMRAQHDAGLLDRSRRVLEWLHRVQGGRAGSWFEEIPSLRTTARDVGIIPWTNGEICLFMIRHLLGIRFTAGRMVIRPSLFPGSPSISATVRYRESAIHLNISGSGALISAQVNGAGHPISQDGSIHLPADFAGGEIDLLTAG